MAGVNVKIGVTGISQFKQDINSANQQIKTMNADLALVEKQFKQTGDAQAYMQAKTELLEGKLAAQKAVLKNAEDALKSMKDNGVSPASAAFQEMQRKIINAKGDMIDTETQLKNIGKEGDNAGKGVGSMNEQLGNIGKGVSWENVTQGLKDLNRQLESGAKAAINLGKRILQSAMGSTGYADELLTMATKYGIDTETLQKMQKVSEYIDTDVDTILNAKQRLAKNAGSMEELLGFSADGMTMEDAFWKAGEAIMAMTNATEQENAAQKLFGREWKDLVPLFTAGQEAYNAALEEQNVLTDEQVRKLGEADDAIKSVEQQVQQLKNEFWAANADKITSLMEWIVDNRGVVVGALEAIGIAFAGMKMGEFALNVTKVVKGFETLWKGAGNPLPNTPTGTGGGGGTGAGTATAGATVTKFVAEAGGWGALMTPMMVSLAGILPAVLANNADYQRATQKQAARVSNASGLSDNDRWFLEAAANALGPTGNDMLGGDFAAIEALLMGMNNRSDLQKMQLHNLLNGATTSQGNYTWNELQRLWGGEEMDMGRLTAILDSVTEAYDRMAQEAEDNSDASDKVKDAGDQIKDAAKDMSKLPGETAAAVSNALNGASVVIDGAALTGVVGQLMANYVVNQ